MKICSVMLLVLCLSDNVIAVTLDAVQQQFSRQPVVRAQFEQVRRIQGMPNPLRSTGEILVARDKGLWWSQKTPFPMTLILTDNQMVQTLSGQAPQIITAKNNPQMFQFNSLLRAIFEADRRTLEQNFSLVFNSKNQGAWQLILKPKAAPLNKLFDSITLQGKQLLDTIQLNDKQGDVTEIRFINQRTEPATLTAHEKQRFVH